MTETNNVPVFEITSGEFTGPLDLLLDLIEKRKLHISEVSLATVTDDFLNYLRRFNEFPIAEAAQFIAVAATLLLIKSRSLLPTLTLTDEETESVSDLEYRLQLFAVYRRGGTLIQKKFGVAPLFSREYHVDATPLFVPPQGMTSSAFPVILRTLVEHFPKLQKLPERIVESVVSLEEMIDRLTIRMTKDIRTSFRDFAKQGNAAKVDIIVGFLALLELVKQGILHAEQHRNFDDIHMESRHIQTPHYGE